MTSAAASRWIALVLLAIGLVGTGVVATDAGLLSADDDPKMRDEPHEYDVLENKTGIVAEPSDGPNGAYAYLDGDGELVIDLTVDNDALEGDGISAGAVTGIDDVVTLRNTGDESAKVWLEHDAENVTFRTGGNDPIEGADEAAILEPAESIHVGFVVDARNLEDGEAAIESLRFRTVALEGDDGRDPSADADSSGDTDLSTSSPSPAVEVVKPDSKIRTVTVSDVRGRTVPIDLGSLRVDKGVILEGVTVRFDDVEEATFEIRADRDRKKGDSRTQSGPTDVSAIGAVALEEIPAAPAIESVEYRFTVNRDRIEEHTSPNADEPAIGFYQPADGTWERTALEVDNGMETRDNSENGDDGKPIDVDRYTATATTDSLSSGVVAVPTTDSESTEADFEPNTDSDADADGSATSDADDSDPDPDSADSSGSPVLVAFAGGLLVVGLLRKLTQR